MSKFQLMQLLFSAENEAVNFPIREGGITRYIKGYISQIQREDGSGRSFNITIRTPELTTHTFHLRTID